MSDLAKRAIKLKSNLLIFNFTSRNFDAEQAFQEKIDAQHMTQNNSLLLCCFLSVFAFSVSAQGTLEKTDPEAKKILDKVRRTYEGYKTLEANFSLVIELPGQPKETQKGTIVQSGEKFRLDMSDQVIVSDTKTTWVYLKKNNEVQINNAEEGGNNDFLTPKELLKRYQKGDFLYAVIDKVTENGKVLTQIEFKPKDKKSEYSKLRVSIDEKNSSIQSLKAFGKDGSRFTFILTKTSVNKKLDGNAFIFDQSKYPGVRVEDLRM
jgi:outer membrane lipoprotein carrier protein